MEKARLEKAPSERERSTFLANRLQEVLLDGDWVANTNYKKVLLGVSWQDASQSIGGTNSIAELTFHVHYYLKGVLEALKGEGLHIRDQYSFDMPPVESEADWQAMKELFLVTAQDFVGQVGIMAERKWEEPFVKEKYGTYLRNIEGVIEHCYYHLGQIVLIKRMLDHESPENP